MLSLRYKAVKHVLQNNYSCTYEGHTQCVMGCACGLCVYSITFKSIYIAPKQSNCLKAFYRAQGLNPL